MNKKSKAVSLLLLPLLLGSVSACGKKTPSLPSSESSSSTPLSPEVSSSATTSFSPVEKVLTGVEVATLPNRVSYYEGETFNPEGLVVKAVYKDQTKKVLTAEDYTLSPAGPLMLDDTKITVTYQEFHADIAISVSQDTTHAIRITTPATKTSYYVGEVFDPTGMVLEVEKESGKKSNVAYSAADPLFSYDKTPIQASMTGITVTYDGKSAVQPITILEDAASTATIKSAPSKTTYYPGESFDATGLVLEVTYLSGKKEEVTYAADDALFVLPTEAFEEGDTEATFTYSGITLHQAVTVLSVTGIEIATEPTKTTYFVGDYLDTTGLVVNAVYSDASTKELDSSLYTYDKKDALTTSDTKVTITYRTFTASFTITVKEDTITSVSLKAAPTKSSYYPGETFDAEGLVLTVVRESGASEEVTYSASDKRFSVPTGVLTESISEVTIQYAEKDVKVPLTVHKATALTLATEPTKLYYEVGESFDTTGMSIHGTFDDGADKEIPLSLFTYTPNGALGESDTTITFSYEALTLAVAIHIGDHVTSVTVKTEPTKTVYSVGDVYDPTGLVVTVTYESGKTEEVTYSASDTRFTFDSTPVTEDTEEVELTFEGISFKDKVPMKRAYVEFGAYVKDIQDGVHTENYTHTLLYGFTYNKYLIDSVSYGEIKGSVTDGTYLYVAATNGENGTKARILKLDPSNGDLLAYSASYTAWGSDVINLWLKDGTLYTVADSKTRSIATSSLTSSTSEAALTTINDLSFATSDGTALAFRPSGNDRTNTIYDIKYEADQEEYVVLAALSSGSKLFYYDAAGTYLKEADAKSSGGVLLSGNTEKDNLWTPHLQVSKNYVYVTYFNACLNKDVYSVFSLYQFDGTLVVSDYQISQTALSSGSYSKCWDLTVFNDTLYSFFSDPNWNHGDLEVGPALVKTSTSDLQIR